MKRRHETPVKRTNPSGAVRWTARYTGPDGKTRSAGTFRLKGQAQDAIDGAYDAMTRRKPGEVTFGAYAETWTERHPRSKRTNDTNDHRISRVLEVVIDSRFLKDWPLHDLRRRHAHELVDHLLRKQGRARQGVVGILGTLSALAEDAITDEVCEMNPFKGVRVRASDVRIRKGSRAKVLMSFDEMHTFAAAARKTQRTEPDPRNPGERRNTGKVRDYEALVRTFGDTGMRLGEVLPLERGDLKLAGCTEPRCEVDGPHFHIARTAHEGQVLAGTKNDHGETVAGRVTPCPAGLAEVLSAMPRRIDTPLLFSTPSGLLWRERNFYRDVWTPAREATGMVCTPHDCRHSYVSHLRAAGIDDADLAAITGHTVETMIGHYTHALGQSFDKVRGLIG